MSGEFDKVKESLVDQILLQGQRLRNAMVQSILQNDPLNSDFIYNKAYNTPMSSASTLASKSKEDQQLLDAFLSGDYLTKDQEQLALNSIRSMPLSDVYETTERAFSKCCCTTCAAYHVNNLKCDLRRPPNCNRKDVLKAKEGNQSDGIHVLKQVDSLKVILQSIHLNSLGNKKVSQSSQKRQYNSGLNETYFVEYYIPEVFRKEIIKSMSKTDSGLESNNVRICARRASNVIHIRQIFIHSVSNFYSCNLDDYDLTFSITYKGTGQKKSELLGVAKFNLGLFKNAKNASCGKSLPIYLNDASPITVGTLKVTLQLGAGKLYFGQEFLDAVLLSRGLIDTDNSEDNSDFIGYKNDLPVDQVPSEKTKKETAFEKTKESNKSASKREIKSQKCKASFKEEVSPIIEPEVHNLAYFQQNKTHDDKLHLISIKDNFIPHLSQGSKEAEDILFGFLYVSEAQFLNLSSSSFILCQPYCQNGTSTSRIVYNSSNPLYNFCQTIPLLYEENLLLKLRENFMVLEFWEKSEQTEELFGLTRLPLHQFYLGYRNSIILKHLRRNKLPIIGTDWWEPIYSTDNNELIGQVQVLTALGTEDQIKNLEIERGFKDDIVKAKFPNVGPNNNGVKQSSYFADRAKVNKILSKPLNNKGHTRVNHSPIRILKKEKKSTELKPLGIDVAIQSNIDSQMDIKDNSSKPAHTQDTLSSFLKLLEQVQRPQCVENSTNTENMVPSTSLPAQKADTSPPPPPPPQFRKTSDLLDSLQKALSLDSLPATKVDKPLHFKAQIIINKANQLPSRRRSKSKRAKGKSPKQEDNILPSTYVTFETLPGDPLQITNVYPKSTSPQWNYRCEVNLPLDLLTNGQKRLIFKVWKKCTNAVLQPNMQTDLVLGFAALDLSVLSVGLPNVQGWFNIIDFSGKLNGQINIHVNPLEKIQKVGQKGDVIDNINSNILLANQTPENDECNELFSRALKRKFTELDEITQRLRLRLSEVVSEDSEGLDDDVTDEFEHDINNLCVEDDFDLINFEEEARKFSINQSQKSERKEKPTTTSHILSVDSEAGTSQQQNDGENQDSESDKLKSTSSDLLTEKQESSSTSRSLFSDKHLAEGKHRIDTLLEKLSLITAEANQPFSNRYVSGCSAASNDVDDFQDIFKDLEQHSRPNITAANSFDPVLFQQLYGGSMPNGNRLNIDVKNSSDSSNALNGSSETSVLTNFSDCRPNPDGQGTTSEDKGTQKE